MNDSTELGKYKQKLLSTKNDIERLKNLIKEGNTNPDFICGFLISIMDGIERKDSRYGV